VFLAVVVLSGGVLAGQEKTQASQKKGPYEMKGSEAPVEYVLETFLSLASGAHGGTDHDPESYRDFCHEYSIDSRWPSAERLGTVHRRIYDEYVERLAQARVDPDYKDVTGLDPNDWKTEELGRAFAEVYEDLRQDGLPFAFDRFVAVIEVRNRGSFNSYGSEPYDSQKLERHAGLFWRGAEEVSTEAADFHSQEVER
jgi:hypothetical protein